MNLKKFHLKSTDASYHIVWDDEAGNRTTLQRLSIPVAVEMAYQEFIVCCKELLFIEGDRRPGDRRPGDIYDVGFTTRIKDSELFVEVVFSHYLGKYIQHCKIKNVKVAGFEQVYHAIKNLQVAVCMHWDFLEHNTHQLNIFSDAS